MVDVVYMMYVVYMVYVWYMWYMWYVWYVWYMFGSGHVGSHVAGIVIRAFQLVPNRLKGSDLGSGSLPRPPRLGALPAVPRHPVRALALHGTIPRSGAAV